MMDVLVCFLILSLNNLDIAFATESFKDVELPVKEVEVKFYYDVHCPSSIDVYQRHITSLVKILESSISIRTYPFGNAKFLDAAETKVKCQHGKAECYGNKLHACAINQLKAIQKYVEYNSCLMSNGSDDSAADNCGVNHGVDSEPIKRCAKSQEGQDLLIYYGKETLKARPGQNYVPYILINGKEFDEEKNSLMHEVCTAFKNPPETCKTLNAKV